jgi:hypothetical protein
MRKRDRSQDDVKVFSLKNWNWLPLRKMRKAVEGVGLRERSGVSIWKYYFEMPIGYINEDV